MVLYECDICGGLHPWEWNGDCRDDAHRYADVTDAAEREGVDEADIIVLSMGERVQADLE